MRARVQLIGDVVANLLYYCVVFGLTAPSDEDIGTLGDELLRPREPAPLSPPVITATFLSTFPLIVIPLCRIDWSGIRQWA